MKEKLYFIPLRWTSPTADRIITTTEFVRKELRRFRYAGRNQIVDLAPSGVAEIFKPAAKQDAEFLLRVKEKYSLPDSYLLFAGRLTKRKNIQGILQSLPLLKNKDIKLVIAGGEDSKKPTIARALAHQGVVDRVLFTGFVPDADMAAIMAMAKIFCFPSYAEGFGLPPLEAMASGIPSIVSESTAMPEVCNNAALYVRSADSVDIAEKINLLLENPVQYSQMVDKGLAWSAQYKWKETAIGIMNSINASLLPSQRQEPSLEAATC